MIHLLYNRRKLFIMIPVIFFVLIFQEEAFAETCLDKSYKAAKVNKSDRLQDLDYSLCPPMGGMCCCTDQIIGRIQYDTKEITQKRVNPAVDNLIMALRNQRKASDIKIEELVHLKYVNAIYSFYDKDGEKMKKEKLTMPADDEDGCLDEIAFRKLEQEDLQRASVYREGILKELLNILYHLKKSEKMIENKNMIKLVD